MKNSIEKHSELWKLVENDSTNHKLKEIAELFLEAMTDWPTYNQELISEFITEIKDFFGSPLTLKKIDSKQMDFNIEENIWRKESGSSIAEMIEFSKLYYDETDFDKIVFNILNYYSNR